MADKPPALGEGATQTFHADGDGHEPTMFFKGHDVDANFANLVLRRRLLAADVVQACMATVTEQRGAGANISLADFIVERQLLTRAQTDELQGVLTGDDQKDELGGFKVIDRIGEGAMGTVYMAVQKALDRIVALKVLPEDLAADPKFIQRFLREAKVAARIQHANVVRAIDVGESNGKYYFAMEMVEGQSLHDLIEEKGRLTEEEAVGIVIQATQGLEAAWRDGLVHRDIKPDNILITYDGIVKLADLGLARDVAPAATQLTQQGMTLGTPHYISPEQGTSGDVDIRTDVFALGVTLFRMVTGEFPWDGNNAFAIMTAPLEKSPKNVRKLNKSVSKQLEHIIAAMIDKDREKRYPDPLVLLQDLKSLEEGEPPKFAVGSAGARTQAIERAHASRTTTTVPTASFAARRREKRPGLARLIAAGLVVSFMMMGAGYLVRDRLVPLLTGGDAAAVASVRTTPHLDAREIKLRSAAVHALREEFDMALICCADAAGGDPPPTGALARSIAELARTIERARHVARARDAQIAGNLPEAVEHFEHALRIAEDDIVKERLQRVKQQVAEPETPPEGDAP